MLFHPHSTPRHGWGAGNNLNSSCRVGRRRRRPGARPVVRVKVVRGLVLVGRTDAEVQEHLFVDVEGGKGAELGVEHDQDEQRAKVVAWDVVVWDPRPCGLQVKAIRDNVAPVLLLGIVPDGCGLYRDTCRVLDELEI